MVIRLFKYFNQKDPISQKIWYTALKTVLNKSIVVDDTGIIAAIPKDSPDGQDLAIVLQTFISDCQAIQNVPAIKEK